VNPPLDAVPIFVRGGSIVPEQPIVQNTGEVPQGPLRISVYPGANCRGSLYQDDGNTLAYQHGDYTRMQFTCESGPESLKVNFSTPEARYKTWWGAMQFLVYGFGSKPHELAVNGKSVSNWQYDPSKGMVSVSLAAVQGANITITK
jgi:alpha-glucosidase (family GH31 glycosyl hydrolase)